MITPRPPPPPPPTIEPVQPEELDRLGALVADIATRLKNEGDALGLEQMSELADWAATDWLGCDRMLHKALSIVLKRRV